MSRAGQDELNQILRGYEIAPVPLNLAGKDWRLVGLGSYIVNTTGCNDCHTHPNWANGGNPYLGATGADQFGAVSVGRTSLCADNCFREHHSRQDTTGRRD